MVEIVRAGSCPNLTSRLENLNTFQRYAEADNPFRMALSEVPLALQSMGFNVTEKLSAGLLHTQNEEALTQDQFESIVARSPILFFVCHACPGLISMGGTRCILHDNDFPSDQLYCMFAKFPTEDGLLDLESVDSADSVEREKLNRFLRSNGVDLDTVDIGNKVSLSELEIVIAQELDLKRKAEWLTENGVIRKLSSILPRSVFGSNPDGDDGSRIQVSENLFERLPRVGLFIEERAKNGPPPVGHKGLKTGNSSNLAHACSVPETLPRRPPKEQFKQLSHSLKNPASGAGSTSPVSSLVYSPPAMQKISSEDLRTESTPPRSRWRSRWMSTSQLSSQASSDTSPDVPVRKKSSVRRGSELLSFRNRFASSQECPSVCDGDMHGGESMQSMRSKSSWIHSFNPMSRPSSPLQVNSPVCLLAQSSNSGADVSQILVLM
eukprot:3853559-Rhodomonas_salina.2